MKYYYDRAALPAVAIRAISNHHFYAHVFAAEIEAMNVTRGVKAALTRSGPCGSGAFPRRLNPFLHQCLSVPVDDTPDIQEAHILMGHILCELVETELFPQPASEQRAREKR